MAFIQLGDKVININKVVYAEVDEICIKVQMEDRLIIANLADKLQADSIFKVLAEKLNDNIK